MGPCHPIHDEYLIKWSMWQLSDAVIDLTIGFEGQRFFLSFRIPRGTSGGRLVAHSILVIAASLALLNLASSSPLVVCYFSTLVLFVLGMRQRDLLTCFMGPDSPTLFFARRWYRFIIRRRSTFTDSIGDICTTEETISVLYIHIVSKHP